MTAFLIIKGGRIEVHADISDHEAPAVFATDRADEVARWLHDHGISDWTNSSSMDFSSEYGWPQDGAAGEVSAEFDKLKTAEPTSKIGLDEADVVFANVGFKRFGGENSLSYLWTAGQLAEDVLERRSVKGKSHFVIAAAGARSRYHTFSEAARAAIHLRKAKVEAARKLVTDYDAAVAG